MGIHDHLISIPSSSSSSSSPSTNTHVDPCQCHHLTDDEKKLLNKYATMGLRLMVILRYYEFTNQTLPNSFSWYNHWFELDRQQLRDIVELILYHVEHGNRPIVPLPSLVFMDYCSTLPSPPHGLPTVDQTLRYQLRQNKLKFAWKVFRVCFYFLAIAVLARFGSGDNGVFMDFWLIWVVIVRPFLEENFLS